MFFWVWDRKVLNRKLCPRRLWGRKVCRLKVCSEQFLLLGSDYLQTWLLLGLKWYVILKAFGRRALAA